MSNKICDVARRRTSCVLLLLKYALLLFACSEQPKRERKPEKILENAENKLRIPLEDQTSNTSFGLHYYDGAVPLLFKLLNAQNQPQVYDLEAKTLRRTMQFEREGDLGIGGLRSYHVHSAYSIFLFTDQPGKMYLTDMDQSYISVLSYSTPEGYADPEASYLPFSFPTISRDASSSELLGYTLTQHYEGLIYDPYREVFFRFCFPTAEIEKELIC